MLPRLRAEEDVAVITAEVHRIKGVAATLGASAIAGAAAEVEREAASGAAKDALLEGQSFEALVRAIQEVLEGVPHLEAVRPPEPMVEHLDRERARWILPLLRRLERQLAAQDFAAIAGIDELSAALGASLPEERRQLQAFAQRLDFSAAGAVVAVVASRMARAADDPRQVEA